MFAPATRLRLTLGPLTYSLGTKDRKRENAQQTKKEKQACSALDLDEIAAGRCAEQRDQKSEESKSNIQIARQGFNLLWPILHRADHDAVFAFLALREQLELPNQIPYGSASCHSIILTESPAVQSRLRLSVHR